MPSQVRDIADEFLATLHPYDSLPSDARSELAASLVSVEASKGQQIYTVGAPLEGLYLIVSGEVEIHEPNGALVSILGPRNSFGERGLMRDGLAATSAQTVSDTLLYIVPSEVFLRLIRDSADFARFFNRSRAANTSADTLYTLPVSDLMTRDPATCGPETELVAAARVMRDRRISCLVVTEGDRPIGILTTRDLTDKALAEGLAGATPVAQVMTVDPVALTPDALCADVLHQMLERHIGHLPIVEGERLVGIVTQTDLTRHRAISSGGMIRQIADAGDPAALAGVVTRIPDLLVHLVAAGSRHDIVTRLVTDVADAATRRLLALAEAQLGAPPVPYLWLACGSQGRREQTGVSDQDNCLILGAAARAEDMEYFQALARFVSDGLDVCGYYHCPGEMMATNPRWCQPLPVWRDYFAGWIRKPDPMAQMLASVMFDLRPIGGEIGLYGQLIAETLEQASLNSIFVAHMIANSVKHVPPLSLFRSFATIRSGEHKDSVDLKLNGVVPVVDLARIYAIQSKLQVVNTRDRLLAAAETDALSPSGARDLIDAYDLIAATRLHHQVGCIQAGKKPDNFMIPGTLSDLERSHLRDAFVVVKTMQSALAHGKAMIL
ncbi:DUF294 nucleotidyltransferase-like domain-containing protein [Pelagibius sp. Alg239-R121]|uniref:DUF294 nucleotidyltransferase-like domain-containing protein n=1 Tax=Pelagibius sp. Alg239-R121 TaxID=2993448 RepID=UPI0024A725A2|nr:DUF294 nucleotidyltransferase-like domain-containing protein [Pelagibius sp. Alg239-R121]